MTPFLKSAVIIDWILALVFLILAVVAYRAKKTIAFLLLMLASICYFLRRFALVAIAYFSTFVVGKTSGNMRNWLHPWGSFVNLTFNFLFVGLIIAALVLFIREQQRVAAPDA